MTFWAAGECVELELGAATARRWAEAIAALPPSLAHKLGVTSATRVAITGPVDDPALAAALAGSTPAAHAADLEIVRADTVVALAE